mmetsp:Transcript_89186/g.158053  ORF Transcript_89186/g.158053 Transcript_89186/m.158053 type:complete len:1948 (+) Transcript_89186:55-5898(+)
MSKPCGSSVTLALEEKVSPSKVGQSGRSQKWLEQLCQVESRLLTNWEEFSEHRSVVETRLKDLQDHFQRSPKKDQQFESELERYQRRIQQIAEEQEEISSRVGELKVAVESGKDSVEGLRSRVAEKLQELAGAFEEHQREASKSAEEVLKEAMAASKRHSRSVGEDLLRKMEELNGKLGDNMASVEEQGALGLSALRQDLRDLAGRMESLAHKGSAEAEARRVEARLEAAWHASHAETQVQISELSQHSHSEADRVKGLEERMEEMMRDIAALKIESQSSKQRADRAEAKLEARLEEFRSSSVSQVSRQREELQKALRDAQVSQMVEVEDRVKQLREEILGGALKDALFRLDSLAEGLRELGREQEMEAASTQEALRNAERRNEKIVADIAAMRSSCAVLQEETSKELSLARNDLSQQLRQLRQQLEERQEQRLASFSQREEMEELRQRLQTRIDGHSEELMRHGKSLESQADIMGSREAEWKHRMEQVEVAVGELREWTESREERFKAASLDLAEQVTLARDETLRLCREHLEEACKTGQRQREKQDRSIADLQQRLENLQFSLQELGLQEMQGRVEALQGALREHAQLQQEQVQQLVEEAKQQSKTMFAEAKSLGMKAKEQLESFSAETRRGQEAQNRRQEVLERQAGDGSNKVVLLQERMEALKATDAERVLHLDRLSRTCSELSDSKSALASDLEASQRHVDRQLEEILRRVDASTAAVAGRCSEALAELKGTAREWIENSERTAVTSSRDFLEQRTAELREQLQGSDEAWRHEFSKLRAADEVRTRQDEARGRELTQLRSSVEATQKELKQEMRQHVFTQLQHLEDSIGKELKQLSTSSEAQVRELGLLKVAEETSAKDLSLLQASSEVQSKELLKLQAAADVLTKDLRQRDEQRGTEIGRLHVAEESLRRELKQKEESFEKDLGQAQGALEAKLGDLRDRTEGLVREMARQASNEELLRKDLEERTGVLGRDLRHVQTSQDELRQFLQGSLDSSTEELRHLLQEGLASSRAESGERESRLASRVAFTGHEAEELRRGFEELRRGQGSLKDLVSEVANQSNERLKQQSVTAANQIQEAKTSLEEQLRSQASFTSERIAETQKEARDKAAQVGEDLGKALVELRAAAHSLGLRVQAGQDQAAEFQKKSSEHEERLQRTSRDLRQQTSELQAELKAVAESFAQQHSQQAEATARQSSQLAAQLKESKELGQELHQSHEASKDQLAKLRVKTEEQSHAVQLSLETLDKSSAELMRKSEQRLQDMQKQLQGRLAENEGKVETIHEELTQRSRREKRQAEDFSKLQLQVQGLEQRQERDSERTDAQRVELTKLVETRFDAATGQAASSLQEQEAKVHRNLEALKAESGEAVGQLSRTLREEQAKAKTWHEELVLKQNSIQSLASESKAAATAATAEAARCLDVSDQRMAEKLRTEMESLLSAVKESKDEARATVDSFKTQLTTRLDHYDLALKDLSRTSSKELEERSRRHAEVEERLGSRLTETSEMLRRQFAEQSEAVAEVRAAALESTARSAREASEGSAELRRRVEDWVERISGELRETQAGLMARLSEAQAEVRQQIATEKVAAAGMVAELGRQQDDKMRELSAAADRDRFSSEEHRRVAQASLQDLSGKMEQRLKDHSEASSQALKSSCDGVRTAFEERALSLENQLAATDKDLRHLLREELPSLSRKVEADRQMQAAGLEELKKASSDRHQQLQRKLQSEAEQVSAVSEKLATLQEEWKARHKEAAQAAATSIGHVQAASEQLGHQLQEEIAAAQVELRAANAELSAVHRSHREKTSASLSEASRQHEDFVAKVQRRFEEFEALTAQSRLLGLITEHVDGLVRGVTQQELTNFQREALDSVEWKLERCVQWLHGANVKLGLNPQGTMFSTDRFREVLFNEADQMAMEPRSCGAAMSPYGGSVRRSHSARARSGPVRGRIAG